MIPDLSTWTPDEKLGLGMVVTAVLLLAAWGCFVIESKTRALGNGRRVPVVPLKDMFHEQASAEAYDDIPDMDVEAGIPFAPLPQRIPGEALNEAEADDAFASRYDAVRAEMRRQTLTTAKQRKAWEDEWEARLAADFGEGSR